MNLGTNNTTYSLYCSLLCSICNMYNIYLPENIKIIESTKKNNQFKQILKIQKWKYLVCYV